MGLKMSGPRLVIKNSSKSEPHCSILDVKIVAYTLILSPKFPLFDLCFHYKVSWSVIFSLYFINLMQAYGHQSKSSSPSS